MNKAVLIINMPESCAGCPLCYSNSISDWCLPRGNHHGDVFSHVTGCTKPDWCPLKPLPKEKEEHYVHEYDAGYKAGWDDCAKAVIITTLLGDKNDD